MYNQVNHGPHTPMPPVYQQRPQVPPPPSHFPQVPPVPHVPTGVPPHIGLSAPHVFIHGPPTPSSTIPLNPSTQVPSSLVQNTGQSYGIARPSLHGNSMMPQTFPSFGQNSQHSSNLGVHTRHIQPPVPPSVPPPPLSHPQQELSWTPGPPLTGLPAPPPPLPPCPPQPGDVQSLQHIPPAPPAPSTSSFHSPTPDGVYLHSSVENYRVVSSTAPPLPSSPPPILPSPPPLASPKSSKPCSSELNTVDLSGSAPVPMDGGSNGEVAIANGDGLSATRNSILEYRWHDKKSASLLGPLAVDSSRPHDHLNVATEGDSAADSDMEMEDDITLSDKDQGLTHTIEALNQQHDLIVEDFSVKDQMPWMQNSTEEDPVKDLDGGVSSSGPLGASKECEGPKPSFGLAQINSSKPDSKDHTAMNDSVGVAQIPQCTTVSPLADDLTQTGTSYPSEASPHTDSGQLTRNGSPIRLLQDYASDDSSDNEDEACFADTSTLTVTTRAATSASVVHEDSGVFLKTDAGSKIPSTTEKGCELLSKASQNGSETFLHLVKQDKDTHRISVASGTNDASNEHNLENQFPENVDTSVETSKGKGVLSSAIIDHGSRIGNAQQEDEKRTSKFELNPLKVDKFGRLAKGGPTDSDSDDSQNHRSRRRNKRDRSWSRSQSPIERTSRRRRRSPRRRKDKRSWSRSWSPRNRRSRSGSRGRNRSRSRSPILRRSRKFNIENVRREKGQCFDFLQGRCYRGGSCRYVHHEPDRNASSKRYRNKHDLEVSSSSKTSRLHESMKKTSAKVSGDEFDVVRGQDVLLCQNIRSSSTDQDVEKRKDDSVRKAVVSTTSDYDGQTVNAASIKSESSRDPEVRGNFVAREDPSTNESFRKTMDCRQQPLVDGFPSNSINSSGDALKLSGGASQDVVPSENGSSVQQFQPNILVGVLEPSDQPSQHINASFVSDLSPDGDRLIDGAGKISTSKPLQYMFPATQQQSISSSVGEQLSAEQSSLCTQASKELPVHSSSVGFPLHSYQLPPPPALPHSYGENSVQPQLSRDNTIFPYQSMTREPYSAQSDTQNHHFSVPSNISWTTLPLPPPPQPPSLLVYNSSSNAAVPKSYVSSEFNENKSHLRSDCVSQISVRPGLPLNIQGSEYQDQAYPTMKEHSRPLMLTETFSSKPLLQGNMTCESRAGSNISKDDHYKQLSKHDSQFSSFSYFPNPHAHSKPFSWESDVNRQQLTSSYTLPPEEHLKSASLIHPFSPKQQPVYSLQYSASDGNMGVPGETGTVSRFPPDIMDSNHSASLTNFVGSKISAHFNPYASTFEKPLSSKFSSSMFRQEKDIIHVNHYGSSSSLQQTPVNGQGVFGVGSRQMVSSPKSARMVGQILPRSGNDQYDPLFDSIEPSSTSLKKFELDQKQEVTGESNVSLRPKSSYKSINVEENKEWEVGAVASTSSQNNDEYGETADAEVGAVENESLSNHVDVANMTTSEIEIDQVKSPGKKKKSKDSRSMKLFKVSIANFVKEVLKPSWRQGNMSKVAFKTIVKKTVDKVSGAMKGHRVPKSQAKINQYIDSSQRKLTKLVMGYVEKYVKV